MKQVKIMIACISTHDANYLGPGLKAFVKGLEKEASGSEDSAKESNFNRAGHCGAGRGRGWVEVRLARGAGRNSTRSERRAARSGRASASRA